MLQSVTFGLICICGAKAPAVVNLKRASLAKMMNTAKKRRTKRSSEAEVVIPDKLYFRIGEVSKLSRLAAYVLRFWETEFPQLKPTKSSTGQRMYRRRDVENILLIKETVVRRGLYHCRRAREAEDRSASREIPPVLPFPKRLVGNDLKRLRQGLQEILNVLSTRHSL